MWIVRFSVVMSLFLEIGIAHYNMYVLRLYVNFTYVYVFIIIHFTGEFHYDIKQKSEFLN
jgi:hypothetical protein